MPITPDSEHRDVARARNRRGGGMANGQVGETAKNEEARDGVLTTEQLTHHHDCVRIPLVRRLYAGRGPGRKDSKTNVKQLELKGPEASQHGNRARARSHSIVTTTALRRTRRSRCRRIMFASTPSPKPRMLIRSTSPSTGTRSWTIRRCRRRCTHWQAPVHEAIDDASSTDWPVRALLLQRECVGAAIIPRGTVQTANPTREWQAELEEKVHQSARCPVLASRTTNCPHAQSENRSLAVVVAVVVTILPANASQRTVVPRRPAREPTRYGRVITRPRTRDVSLRCSPRRWYAPRHRGHQTKRKGRPFGAPSNVGSLSAPSTSSGISCWCRGAARPTAAAAAPGDTPSS